LVRQIQIRLISLAFLHSAVCMRLNEAQFLRCFVWSYIQVDLVLKLLHLGVVLPNIENFQLKVLNTVTTRVVVGGRLKQLDGALSLLKNIFFNVTCLIVLLLLIFNNRLALTTFFLDVGKREIHNVISDVLNTFLV